MLAKTATLEMTPAQAETVAKAQGMGQISLSLRPLSEEDALAAVPEGAPAPTALALGDGLADDDENTNTRRRGPEVAVIRYGIPARDASPAGGEQQRTPQ